MNRVLPPFDLHLISVSPLDLTRPLTPIPYPPSSMPCQPEDMLAGQTLPRCSRPSPHLSPCLAASQHLTAAHCPLPEPGQVVDHRENPAPSAIATCRSRAIAPHPACVHMPPRDRSPCPPRRHDQGSTPDTPVRCPTPHSYRSPSKTPPLPLRVPASPDRLPPPLSPHLSSRASPGDRALIAILSHAASSP